MLLSSSSASPWTYIGCISLWMVAQSSCATAGSAPIEPRSFQLGIIAGFAEVVHLGVKTLALSEPMEPDVMDALLGEAERIAERNDVRLWRETALIETDLYPPEIARGKHVLLIYRGDTLESYLTLKKEREALVASGEYVGAAREDIARRFGRLLSYPDTVVDKLLRR